MKTIGIFAIIAIIIVIFLLLRFMIKRLWLFHLLNRFAKEHNYTCTIPRSCLLPNNRNNHYVQICTANTVYNIKLFGLLRKQCEIHFWNTREYAATWYASWSEYTSRTAPLDILAKRRRSLGKTDWLTADGVPALLISPAHAPVCITQTDENHLIQLRAGDKLGNAIFADLDYLLRYIEKYEN